MPVTVNEHHRTLAVCEWSVRKPRQVPRAHSNACTNVLDEDEDTHAASHTDTAARILAPARNLTPVAAVRVGPDAEWVMAGTASGAPVTLVSASCAALRVAWSRPATRAPRSPPSTCGGDAATR